MKKLSTVNLILTKWKVSVIIAGILMLPFTASSSPVSLKITSDWGSGFNGQITVTNNTQKAYDSWNVEFDFPYNIKSIWNAKIKSHTSNHYVIENTSWNGKLNPGQSTSFVLAEVREM